MSNNNPLCGAPRIHGELLKHGWTAARHFGEVGADNAKHVHLHAEHGSVILDRDLNRLGIRPAVAGRLVTLGVGPQLPFRTSSLARPSGAGSLSAKCRLHEL